MTGVGADSRQYLGSGSLTCGCIFLSILGWRGPLPSTLPPAAVALSVPSRPRLEGSHSQARFLLPGNHSSCSSRILPFNPSQHQRGRGVTQLPCSAPSSVCPQLSVSCAIFLPELCLLSTRARSPVPRPGFWRALAAGLSSLERAWAFHLPPLPFSLSVPPGVAAS